MRRSSHTFVTTPADDSHLDAVLRAFGIRGADPEAIRKLDLPLALDCSRQAPYRRFHRIGLAVLRNVIAELAESFAAQIPFVLLKGEPLEDRLYDRRYARPTGDVDLLVLPGDLECARRHLRNLNYRRKRDEPPRMWAHNQQSWVHRIHGVEVELHWSLAVPGVPSVPLGRLFDTRVLYRFDDGLMVDVLRDDWLFIHLALHFHHHLGFAKGLADIAAWCDQLAAGVDANRLLEHIRRRGLFGLVQWPLHTLARLTETPPPLYCGDVDPAVRLLAEASSKAMRNCLLQRSRSDLTATLVATTPRLGAWGTVPLQAVSMLVCDGWANKARGLLRPIFFGPHRLGRQLSSIAQGRLRPPSIFGPAVWARHK